MARIHCGKCLGVFEGLTVFQRHSCVVGAKPVPAEERDSAANRFMAIDFGSEECQSLLQRSWEKGFINISTEVRCARCGATEENIACKYLACISDADLTQSRKIQSLFDQQQKRGAAYFMGKM
jgi:hypothetical protein